MPDRMKGQTVVKCGCLFVTIGLLALIGEVQPETPENPRSFIIDYKHDTFLKDGQPFRYVSGSIHYFRVLSADWADRLHKLRMGGFNAVQTSQVTASHPWIDLPIYQDWKPKRHIFPLPLNFLFIIAEGHRALCGALVSGCFRTLLSSPPWSGFGHPGFIVVGREGSVGALGYGLGLARGLGAVRPGSLRNNNNNKGQRGWQEGYRQLFNVVEWSTHEPEPGQFRFSGDQDLEQFIRVAQQQDLYVILRVGPFICAERDMGGLPYWLLRLHPNVRLRTSDPDFLSPVDAWLAELLPRIRPLLYENGGPIITVQIENEYGGGGSACDYEYTAHLRDQFIHHLGPSVVLFTVDGGFTNNLRCGKIPGVYATVDFGLDADPSERFAKQRLFEPYGPLVSSEFYPGWIDHWGEPHHTSDPQILAKGLDAILALNASLNMYMFHGGTSFGFSAGSNIGQKFQSCPTSYDYDAPVSEAGDPTEKYPLLRDVIGKYLSLPSGDLPTPSPKGVYGKVVMSPLGGVGSLVTLLPTVSDPWPRTFEELGVSSGIVVYSTIVNFRTPDPARLSLNDLHDRAHILVDDTLVGVASREQRLTDIPVSMAPNSVLALVVESLGRISVGPHLNDFKGLTSNITLNNHLLRDWQMTVLPLTNTSHLLSALSRLPQLLPRSLSPLGTFRGGLTFYQGTFKVPDENPHPLDTFLKLDGWTKGIIWVNDFCLGRYWPEVGPQVTLYVPGAVLRRGDNNTLLLLELEAAPCVAPQVCSTNTDNTACLSLDTCFVTLQDKHEVNGPTPP